MFEKNLHIAYLLDQYACVLGERHRTVLDYYYNQDFSLSEIAGELGISRQGVRDSIKKAEEELFFLEENLGLYQRAVKVTKLGEQLLSTEMSQAARDLINELISTAGGSPQQK